MNFLPRLHRSGEKGLQQTFSWTSILFTAVIGLLLLCTGCGTNGRKSAMQKELIGKSNALSRGYLYDDVTAAEQDLLQNAALLEGATILEPTGRAQLLSLTCFRLYVLEVRIGNSAMAQASLIKARYWSLRHGELLGNNVVNSIRDINEFTPERITKYVDDLDKRHHDGKEARYLETVGNTEAPQRK
jgi:hypothetical protein